MSGTVYFVGAGPGAPDLLTVRAQRIIERADVVIYADSLVHPDVASLARADAEVIGSSTMTLEEITDRTIAAAQDGKTVARLQSGDPSVYGALHEQLVNLEAHSITFEIVPGVSSAFAAAAILGTELTVPGVSQSVIFTRTAGRTGALPEGEELADLARHRTSLALFLSGALLHRSVPALIEGGYPPDTPAALVYRATWEDEQVIRGPLSEIARLTHDAGITKQALLMVGRAMDPEIRKVASDRSHLYDPTYSHGRRVSRRSSTPRACTTPLSPPVDRAETFPGTSPPKESIAVVAATRTGIETARRIAAGCSDARVVVPSTANRLVDSTATIERSPKALRQLIRELFDSHRAIVLVLAAGAAVRLIAPLLQDKRRDPAVVVVDETGQYAISLVGGHRAEANGLARQVADILGGQAVITTASDALGQPSLEQLLAKHGLVPDEDGPAMTRVAAVLVNGEPLGLLVDPGLSAVGEALEDLGIPMVPALDLDSLTALHAPAALVVTDRTIPPRFEPYRDQLLICHPTSLVVGVGCSTDATPEAVMDLVEQALDDAQLSPKSVACLATIDRRAESKPIVELAERYGWRIESFSPEQLNATEVPTPSEQVRAAVGTASVCEAAALLAAEEGQIIVPKRSNAVATVAIVRQRLVLS